jgi:hypothetical protein
MRLELLYDHDTIHLPSSKFCRLLDDEPLTIFGAGGSGRQLRSKKHIARIVASMSAEPCWGSMASQTTNYKHIIPVHLS